MTDNTTSPPAHQLIGKIRLRRATAVVAAVASAVLGWVIIEPVLGSDLRAPSQGNAAVMDIALIPVLVSTAAAGALAWGSLAVLERLTARPRLAWLALATLGFLISLAGPLGGGGVPATERGLLVGLHVIVAAVLIPGLASTARGEK